MEEAEASEKATVHIAKSDGTEFPIDDSELAILAIKSSPSGFLTEKGIYRHIQRFFPERSGRKDTWKSSVRTAASKTKEIRRVEVETKTTRRDSVYKLVDAFDKKIDVKLCEGKSLLLAIRAARNSSNMQHNSQCILRGTTIPYYLKENPVSIKLKDFFPEEECYSPASVSFTDLEPDVQPGSKNLVPPHVPSVDANEGTNRQKQAFGDAFEITDSESAILAIKNSPDGLLYVGQIYSYIEHHFPDRVRRNPTTWKNCVRNTLSSSKCFEPEKLEPETNRGYRWMLQIDFNNELDAKLSEGQCLLSAIRAVNSPHSKLTKFKSISQNPSTPHYLQTNFGNVKLDEEKEDSPSPVSATQPSIPEQKPAMKPEIKNLPPPRVSSIDSNKWTRTQKKDSSGIREIHQVPPDASDIKRPVARMPASRVQADVPNQRSGNNCTSSQFPITVNNGLARGRNLPLRPQLSRGQSPVGFHFEGAEPSQCGTSHRMRPLSPAVQQFPPDHDYGKVENHDERTELHGSPQREIPRAFHTESDARRRSTVYGVLSSTNPPSRGANIDPRTIQNINLEGAHLNISYHPMPTTVRPKPGNSTQPVRFYRPNPTTNHPYSEPIKKAQASKESTISLDGRQERRNPVATNLAANAISTVLNHQLPYEKGQNTRSTAVSHDTLSKIKPIEKPQGKVIYRNDDIQSESQLRKTGREGREGPPSISSASSSSRLLPSSSSNSSLVGSFGTVKAGARDGGNPPDEDDEMEFGSELEDGPADHRVPSRVSHSRPSFSHSTRPPIHARSLPVPMKRKATQEGLIAPKIYNIKTNLPKGLIRKRDELSMNTPRSVMARSLIEAQTSGRKTEAVSRRVAQKELYKAEARAEESPIANENEPEDIIFEGTSKKKKVPIRCDALNFQRAFGFASQPSKDAKEGRERRGISSDASIEDGEEECSLLEDSLVDFTLKTSRKERRAERESKTDGRKRKKIFNPEVDRYLEDSEDAARRRRRPEFKSFLGLRPKELFEFHSPFFLCRSINGIKKEESKFNNGSHLQKKPPRENQRLAFAQVNPNLNLPLVLSGGHNRLILLHNYLTGNLANFYRPHYTYTTDAAWSWDGRSFIASGTDRQVAVTETESRPSLKSRVYMEDVPVGARFTRDSNLAVVGLKSGVVVVLDWRVPPVPQREKRGTAQDGTIVRRVKGMPPITCMDTNPNNWSQTAFGCANGLVTEYNFYEDHRRSGTQSVFAYSINKGEQPIFAYFPDSSYDKFCDQTEVKSVRYCNGENSKCKGELVITKANRNEQTGDSAYKFTFGTEKVVGYIPPEKFNISCATLAYSYNKTQETLYPIQDYVVAGTEEGTVVTFDAHSGLPVAGGTAVINDVTQIGNHEARYLKLDPMRIVSNYVPVKKFFPHEKNSIDYNLATRITAIDSVPDPQMGTFVVGGWGENPVLNVYRFQDESPFSRDLSY